MGALVRVKVIYRPGRDNGYALTFLRYLIKPGKGQEGGAGAYLTRVGELVDLDAFLTRLRGDGWAFQVILSPDPAQASTLPLDAYARAWMLAVEAHLGGRRVEWIGAVHYDEPTHLHIQFLWRGRDLAGKPLRLARETIRHELRTLAQTVEGWFV